MTSNSIFEDVKDYKELDPEIIFGRKFYFYKVRGYDREYGRFSGVYGSLNRKSAITSLCKTKEECIEEIKSYKYSLSR